MILKKEISLNEIEERLKTKLNYNCYKYGGIEVIVNALAVYLGDYSYIRKYASRLLLKSFLNKETYDDLMGLLKKELIGEVNDRNDPRVVEWVKKVVSIGKCQKCGVKEDLQAHHIDHWAECPKRRIKIDNGLCLCRNCHALEHWGEKAYNLIMSGGGG